MGLKLANARIEVRDLHSILRLEIEGREAVIDTEVKPAIRAAGLVFVGEEFRDIVPDRTITVDGGETELLGFSDDPRLFRLFEEFRAACDAGKVPYGSIPIPDPDPEPEPEPRE